MAKRRTLVEHVETIMAGRQRKVPVKLSLDPRLVKEVRSVLTRDGLSLSAHIARLLRQDLDRGSALPLARRRA